MSENMHDKPESLNEENQENREDESQNTATTTAEEKAPAAATPQRSGAVDTGKRIDVSRVILKKNMVKNVDETHLNGDAKTHTNGHSGKNGKKPKQKTLMREHSDEAPTIIAPIKREVKAIKIEESHGHEKSQTIQVTEKSSPQRNFVKPEPKEWDTSGDFAAMLDEAMPEERVSLEVGDRVKAKLIHISKDTAFFALGPKHEGAMSILEITDDKGAHTMAIGDTIDAYIVGVDDAIRLSKRVGRHADLSMLESAKSSGMPVEGKITAVNTGGFEVALSGTRAFCPMGQVDIHFVEDPQTYIGRTLTFLVTQIGGRNIVLSRRALLERERRVKSKERLLSLKVGDRVTGTISRVADFGAFVEAEGIEGLIPLSELGFGHGTQIKDRVHVGDTVTVEVIKIEPDPKKAGQMLIALSLKATLPDPFEAYASQLMPGSSIEGRVARIESFGAFVELFPGLDGMIHVSELSEQRVRHPDEVLKVGEPITVRVIEIDRDRRRVALTLRENVERTSKSEESRPGMKRGDVFDGTVERIERYGVFVKSPTGHTALLPASETGTPRGSDLGKSFAIGTSMPLMVIDVDDNGRIRVSKIAREKAEEQDLVRSFSGSAQKGSGLGTLGDLLKSRTK